MYKLKLLKIALNKLGLEEESRKIPDRQDEDPCSGGLVFYENGDLWSDYFDEAFLEEHENTILETGERLFDGSGIRMMFDDDFFCFYVNKLGSSVGTLVYHHENAKDDHYDDDFEDEYYGNILWFSRVVDPKCGNKGIAKEMLRAFIQGNRHSIIKSETWNRKLDKSLLQMGFKEEKRIDRTDGQIIIVHTLYPRDYVYASSKSKTLTKFANLKALETLGIPFDTRFIINSKVGDKWDIVVAKWILELAGINSKQEYEAFVQPYFGSSNICGLSKALHFCKKLYLKREEDRNKKEDNTYFKCFDNCLAKEKEYFYKYEEANEMIEDSTIEYWESLLKEKIDRELSLFLSSSFVQEVITSKWKPIKAVKNTSYKDAFKEWMENKQHETFLKVSDGWKWIDAGGGHSDWVAEKLKNCGTTTWGNLRALDGSGQYAKMLVLMDPKEKPHAIVTYNPKYIDDYKEIRNEDGEWIRVPQEKVYLGHPEGVGSSILKEEYIHYFKELYDYIKPDKVYISNKSESRYDEPSDTYKTFSNDKLKELVQKEKLMD